MSILQTIDLKKYYGAKPNITRALDGVNFSVEDGEFVYFFLTIEALEDSGLIAFGNALASVGHFDFHIHFPQHHRHSDFPACRGVLHRIVQQVKEGFRCPLAVMGNGQILRAVHG